MHIKIDLPCGFHGHIIRLTNHHRLFSLLAAPSRPRHPGQKHPRHASRRVPGRNSTRMFVEGESSSREEHAIPVLLPVSHIHSTSTTSSCPPHPGPEQPKRTCPVLSQAATEVDCGQEPHSHSDHPGRKQPRHVGPALSQAETVPGCFCVGTLQKHDVVLHS